MTRRGLGLSIFGSRPLGAAAGGGGGGGPAPSATYDAAVRADGPVAYWRMDAAQGAIIPNEIATPNTALTGYVWGADINAVPSIIPTEPDGGAIEIFSAGGRLDPQSSEWFAPVAGFAIEAWLIRNAAVGGSTRAIFSRHAPANPGVSAVHIREVGGVISFGVGRGDGLGMAEGPGIPIADGELVHAVWGWTGEELVAYRNGVAAGAPVAFAGPIQTPNLSIRILNTTGVLNQQWGGILDSMSVYLDWIGEERVAAHYAAGIGA